MEKQESSRAAEVWRCGAACKAIDGHVGCVGTRSSCGGLEACCDCSYSVEGLPEGVQ